MLFLCVVGRSEHISAHSNHGNAAWAGQHGSSHPECRRLPPAPEPAALSNISTSHSLSGTAMTSAVNHASLNDYQISDYICF